MTATPPDEGQGRDAAKRDPSLPASPLARAAVTYAAMGVPLLPLAAGTKTPLITGGTDWMAASSNVEQVHAWWERWPEANIGARCGDQFDVLDFDLCILTTGQVVKDSRPAHQFLEDHALLAGHIGVARTRRGGLHYFYRPSGQRRGYARGAHVDFLAAGGFVLLPPSVVPAGVENDTPVNGPGRYSWIEVLDLTSSTGTHCDWLTIRDALTPASPPRARDYQPGNLAGLAKFVATAQVGARNSALFWAACRAIESGHSDLTILERAAITAGLTEREARSTTCSALRGAR